MLPASLLAAGLPCLSTLTACQHCVEQAGSLVSMRGVELCWLPVKVLALKLRCWQQPAACARSVRAVSCQSARAARLDTSPDIPSAQ